jgi:hypothetical protein
LKDLSASGVCGNASIQESKFIPNEANTPIGTIFPEAKIVWDQHEYQLGRIAVRRLKSSSDQVEIAFNSIDTQIPVSGELTKILDIDFAKEDMRKDRELDPNFFHLGNFLHNEDTSVDLFNRVREYQVFYKEFEKSKRYGYSLLRNESKGTRINLIRARKGQRFDYVMMGSNDYLGLGAHPEVIQAAKEALDKYGFGSTGSPVTTGLTKVHHDLCNKLAELHNKEAAILFNSGYAANVGALAGILRPGDLVVTDQLCHASIQDGLHMARATTRFFKHNNIESLEEILKKERLLPKSKQLLHPVIY